MSIKSTSPLVAFEPSDDFVLREGPLKRASGPGPLARAQRFETICELAGGVAHDFRNILCVISSYADMVALAVKPEAVAARAGEPGHWAEIGEDLKNLQVAVNRGTELSNRLLALAGYEATHTRVLDAGTIVGDLTGLLEQSLGDRIELVTHIAPGTWPVHLVPGQLEQILLNLAVNARYAMDDGGTFTVHVENVKGTAFKGDAVSVRVSDTGIGMTPDTLRHAFEPFFTTKPFGEGTGLGLSSAHGIVSAAGGAMTIESEVGRGTTVTIAFPPGRPRLVVGDPTAPA